MSLNRISQSFVSKNKTVSSITPRPQHSTIHTSQRRKDNFVHQTLRSQSHISCSSKDKSMSDSDSSSASYFDQKFYRCGCVRLNKKHCNHKYQNYLAELREERMRKKQKLVEYFSNKETQSDVLVLSDDDRELDNVWAQTPPRESELQKIAEISQSAEWSKKKFEFSISIDFANHKYFKRFQSKEEAEKCIQLLEQIIKPSIDL